MKPTDFFRDIGANHNLQNVWGAVAPSGDVIMCAWRHHAKPLASARDKWRVRISGVNPHSRQTIYAESVNHIKLVAKGAPGFLVMCSPTGREEADSYATSFDNNYLFIVEGVTRVGDYWYATIDSSSAGKINIDTLRQRQVRQTKSTKKDLKDPNSGWNLNNANS